MTEIPYYIAILNQELEKRRLKNPRFSLRSLARLIKSSPGWLSQLMRGKKGLSREKAEEISMYLKLAPPETRLFVSSAEEAHSRNPQKRAAASLKSGQLKRKVGIHRILNALETDQCTNWQSYSILEILSFQKQCSNETLAKKLNLEDSLVATYVETLVKMGLASKDSSGLLSLVESTETSSDIPSAAIRRYHKGTLELAANAIESQPMNNREFLGMTFAFEKKRAAEAKAFLRDFQRSFFNRFNDPSASNDSVYQFSMQLFRIDQDEERSP